MTRQDVIVVPWDILCYLCTLLTHFITRLAPVRGQILGAYKLPSRHVRKSYKTLLPRRTQSDPPEPNADLGAGLRHLQQRHSLSFCLLSREYLDASLLETVSRTP